MLHIWIIFQLHFSPELLGLGFTDRPFCLVLLLHTLDQLFWRVAPARYGHTLGNSRLHHKLWWDKSFSWHQRNNLLGCQNHKLFLLSNAQRGYNYFQLIKSNWNYCLYHAPIIIYRYHIDSDASMIWERITIDIGRDCLKRDHVLVNKVLDLML